MIGSEDAQKLKKFLGEVIQSADGKKFSYIGTIAHIFEVGWL